MIMLTFLRLVRVLFGLIALGCLAYLAFVLLRWSIAPDSAAAASATIHWWFLGLLLAFAAFAILKPIINYLHARLEPKYVTPLLPTHWKV